MLSITTAQLYAWIAAFVWPLARILAVVAAAPVIGNASVPTRVKIGFAAAITLIVSPTLGAFPDVPPASGTGLLILAQQIAVGAAMGLAMRFVFAAIEMAGELAGLQMGLGFASFFDPQTQNMTPAIGTFLGLVATLIFLALNGHLLVISTLVESFKVFPISADPPSAAGWRTLVDWGGMIFSSGLLMALPVVGALLIANLALAVLMRAAPQLNMFAVGFPITLAIGIVTLALALPYFTPLVERLASDGARAMLEIAAGLK